MEEAKVLYQKKIKLVPKLRFKGFEEGWEKVLLEDVAIRGSGHTPNKSHSNYYNGDIKWVSLADSKKLDKGYIEETESTITIEGVKNSSAVLHPKGSVILSRDAGVGKSAIMKYDMAVSQHFIVWQAKDNILSNWFLYHILQISKTEFERIAIGSTIKTIGLPYFKKLKINIPSFPEQQKIATFLSSVDEKLQQLTRKKELLEQYKKGVMQQLFSGVLRFKDENGKEYEEWEEKRLGEVFKFKQGFQFAVEEQVEIPFENCVEFIRIINVTSSPNDKRYVADPGLEYHISEDDLFMVRYGDAGKIVTGFKGIIANNMFRLMPVSELSKKWYFYFLDSIYEQIHALAGSSTMPAIKFGSINNLKIIAPSLPEQEKIANYLTSIDKKIETIKKEITATQGFKKGLLQQMFV